MAIIFIKRKRRRFEAERYPGIRGEKSSEDKGRV